MVSLKNIIPALISLGVETQQVDDAIVSLGNMLLMLEDVEVKGRKKVDTLLGCMMCIEAIIGKEDADDA